MKSFDILFSTCLVLTCISLCAYCQDVEYGWSCRNNCRSDLSCIDGFCKCLYPNHQVYHVTLGYCESLLLGPCAKPVDGVTTGIPCVWNTECRNETGFQECGCPSGMRQSGRSCRATFGEACISNFDCYNPSSSDWGNSNTVICRNAKCDCGLLETFDEVTGRCIGLVGAICAPGYICVEGSACEGFDTFDVRGTCRCTGDFTTTPDRRCSSKTV